MKTPIFIMGPTASGKHEIAIEIAKKIGAEIISIDSLKVYRGLDIGTAKPSQHVRDTIKHHLIDILEPLESYNAGRFVEDAQSCQDQIKKRELSSLFVGGAFLYYKALVYGMFKGPQASPLRSELERQETDSLYQKLTRLDPDSAEKIHPADKKRIIRALEVIELTKTPISRLQSHFSTGPKLQGKFFCITRDRNDLRERVKERLDKMLKNGFINEAERLAEMSVNMEIKRSIGYKELFLYLENKLSLEEAKEKILARTSNFIRKQFTWIRSLKELETIQIDSNESAQDTAEKILQLI